ncbi:hypothetical protein D3C79_505110 [compost metagenome]
METQTERLIESQGRDRTFSEQGPIEIRPDLEVHEVKFTFNEMLARRNVPQHVAVD